MINDETIKEYQEVLSVLKSYLELIPKVYKSMDIKKLEAIQKEQPHLIVINRLHWHVWSFCDSVIMMNTYRKYAESNMLLRYIFEATLLIQYFHQYPYEAKRWLDLQEITIGKDYDNYKKMNCKDFIAFLRKNNYIDIISKITKDNYKGAKWLNPVFIRQNIDHNRFFTDAPNDELIDGSNQFYSIMSKYAHPSLTIFEYNGKNEIEYELELIKMALNFFDVTNRTFLAEFENFISKEMKEEMEIHILKNIEIFDKKLYNNLKTIAL